MAVLQGAIATNKQCKDRMRGGGGRVGDGTAGCWGISSLALSEAPQ